MWAEACALLEEAERRHRRFFDLLAAPRGRPAWEPPANVLASRSQVEVTLALPGAQPQNLTVSVTATGLWVEALVEPPAFTAGVGVVRLEIPYGRMQRHVELPPGRYTLLDSRLERGILRVRLAAGATP